MMKNAFVALLVVVMTMCVTAFRPNRIMGISRSTFSSSFLQMAWDGTRPPVPNMQWLDQRMDATWGRGKYRKEVWEGDVNPINDWWDIYAPSEEEQEAADMGYNFADPKAYFTSKGMDADKAIEEGMKHKDKLFQQYLEAKSKTKPVTMEEFVVMKREYLALQTKVFEAAFRLQDNLNQSQKGQPSLDTEDTGVQWKNDEQ